MNNKKRKRWFNIDIPGKSYEIVNYDGTYYYIDYFTGEVIESDDNSNFNDRISENLKIEKAISQNDLGSRFDNMLHYYNEKHSDELLHLIIIPSYTCNFDCSYCYERKNKYVMDKSTLESIEKFLMKNTKNYENIFIEWFGGEPLLFLNIIERIMCYTKKVTNNNIFSHVTTNGYDLNQNNVTRLLKCGVNSYTVTIDGVESYHDSTRYLLGNKPSFNRIFNNLKELKDTDLDFEIRLRCNLTYSNIKGVSDLIELWHYKFKDDSRFNDIDIRAVANYNSNVNQKTEFIEDEDLKKIRNELLLKARKYRIFDQTMFHFNEEGSSICYASEKNSMTISPSGKILKCSIALEDDDMNIVGYISKDGEIQYNNNINLWINPKLRKLECCETCNKLITCFNSSCPLSYLKGYKTCALHYDYYNYIESMK